MADNPYERAVPRRYHRVAGLDTFVSQIVQLRGSCDTLRRADGMRRTVGECAYCRFRPDHRVIDVLVPKLESPALFDAIVHVSEALIAGVRLHRFTAAFKAYESLVTTRDTELGAIRHAISHPETVLSRPGTVAALNRLFGGCRINMEDPSHRRTFYQELGRLLIAVDGAIGSALSSGQYRWSHVPPGYAPEAAAYSGWFPAYAG